VIEVVVMAVARALSQSPVLVHSTEVSSVRPRRRFTTAEKLQIVLEANASTERGALGALLRREGLYASQLSQWRRAYAAGELRGASKARGPAPKPVDPSVARIAQLERELAKVTARAERAELLVDAQKKFSQLLGLTLPTPDAPTESR
jgi:transposase